MPLSNCSLIVFNELWFSLQSQVLIVAMQETVQLHIFPEKKPRSSVIIYKAAVTPNHRIA